LLLMPDPWRWFRARLFPEVLGNLERINSAVLPPDRFVAHTMQFPVMTAAERDREFIAHLETDRSRLGKSEMVGIRRLPLADHAWLGCHES
jgi:hypothetical protein